MNTLPIRPRVVLPLEEQRARADVVSAAREFLTVLDSGADASAAYKRLLDCANFAICTELNRDLERRRNGATP